MTNRHTHVHHYGDARDGRLLSSAARHFIRHDFQMVVAMFAGMVVLGAPAGWALEALGSSTSEVNDDAPAVMLLGMVVTMTVLMVRRCATAATAGA